MNDVSVTDWQDYPSAGSTIYSLRKHLKSNGYKEDIEEMGRDGQVIYQLISERWNLHYQFREKPVNVEQLELNI